MLVLMQDQPRGTFIELISVGSDRNCRMDFLKGKKKQLPILVYRILALNLGIVQVHVHTIHTIIVVHAEKEKKSSVLTTNYYGIP